MKLGKIQEVNIFGTLTTNNKIASGTADFPYAKVYISNPSNDNSNDNSNDGQNDDETVNKINTCSSKITTKGYKCCSDNCEVVYVDSDGNWGFENNQWCGCENK